MSRPSSYLYPRDGRVRDLGPDVRAGGGQLAKCRGGPGDRDHRSTSLGERASDRTAIEYEALAAAAGLRIARIAGTPTAFSVIEAVPAAGGQN